LMNNWDSLTQGYRAACLIFWDGSQLPYGGKTIAPTPSPPPLYGGSSNNLARTDDIASQCSHFALRQMIIFFLFYPPVLLRILTSKSFFFSPCSSPPFLTPFAPCSLSSLCGFIPSTPANARAGSLPSGLSPVSPVRLTPGQS